MRWLSLPLLGRELVEMSKRRRTYVLRSACALLAFSLLGVFLADDHPMKLIGKGWVIVEATVWTLLVLIAIVLPVSCASSVIREKEQGTLQLLFLTPIGPWRLVAQKWLSQVVLMLSLLMTFLPLLGVAYAYGGVDTTKFLLEVWCLVLTIAQFAAIGIAVGCGCRGTIVALMSTYLLLLVQCFISSALLDYVIRSAHAEAELGWLSWTSPVTLLLEQLGPHNPFSYPLQSILSYLPSLLSIPCYLAIARWSITRPSSLPGPSRILQLFRFLDRLFERIDGTFGRTFQRELPGLLPVLWRESHRSSFTAPRYLVRLLVVPVTVSVLFASVQPAISYFFTLVLILIACVIYHAIAFDRDRQDQGMEVILSTPMTGSGLVAQKAQALSRFRWVMSAWLILLACMDLLASLLGWSTGTQDLDWPSRFPLELAEALVLPAIISWFALAIGMRVRNRLLALLLSIIPVMLWLLALPMAIDAFFPAFYEWSRQLPMLVSPPLMLIDSSGYEHLCDSFGYGALLLVGVCYGAIAVVLRLLCLHLSPETYQRLLESRR